MEPRTCYLLDGHSLIHQCFHARMGPLTSAQGEPTKAVYNFCQTLFKILASKQPTYFAMAVDGDRSLLNRTKLFPQYKANRKASNLELVSQVERIKDIVTACGLQVVYRPAHEADDVIATLAQVFQPHALVRILSKDKDLYQLLRKGVEIYDPQTEDVVTARECVRRWGVKPSRMVALQALMGDSTDNIPGVRGVGLVTAQRLLQRYGSLNRVYANLGAIAPATRTKLLAARQDGSLRLSRKLVRLDTEVDLDTNLGTYRVPQLNAEAAGEILDELGFNNWRRWFPSS